MSRWRYVVLHLLFEAQAARRDARIRFLMAQVEILRRKLGGNRVIPSPDDRARLLTIGQELDHNVADVIDIVTPQTYGRCGRELRQGRRPKRVGRPKITWDRCAPPSVPATGSWPSQSSRRRRGWPRCWRGAARGEVDNPHLRTILPDL